ncbi:response regulator [Metabacillus malikii]|uniref:Two-component system response regulator YesN n=1 Tax=Metabacillus malikii TaxID=1504265 RepID=A0ABT9ZHM1_9BACI|nr:response regulator [Metabacillus malikii]MDQ0231764.1 two-component system response regulator YesN [Metabacillus malikii]
MYKLLIVDDEKNIRIGIQAMISREFPDLFTFLLASNGKDALELLENEQIDIMLTDIKMPQMDGIALVHEIQMLKHKPEVVMISGYDDFDYAKEAIKYRVKDYLLKPINRDELKSTVTQVVKELLAEKQYQLDFDEYTANQLNYILLNPNISEAEIDTLSAKLPLDQFTNGYYVGIFTCSDSTEQDQGSWIKGVLTQLCNDEQPNILCFLDKDRHVVMLSTEDSVFTQMMNHLSLRSGTLGISGKEHSITKIKTAYEQAKVSLRSHFIMPNRSIIKFNEVSHHFTGEVQPLPIDDLRKVLNMIGTNRDQEIRIQLLKVLNIDTISTYGLPYMEALHDAINRIILDEAFKRLGDESIELIKLHHKVGGLNHFKRFYDYFYELENLILLLHEYHKQLKVVYSEQKYMEKAITYIHEHYNKDLNLAVVSNYVSLNYSYFSHMFKVYTGQNFVDYLKKIRIEQAKVLLKNVDLKIFEVGTIVGYKNPKRFTKVFRELEGISPKEYQDGILLKDS